MLNIKLKSTKNLLRVLSTAENILRANKGENDLRYVKFEKVGDNLCLTAMNSFMRLYYYSDEVESIEGDCALYENKVLMSLFTVLDGAVEISDGVIRGKKCEYSIPNIAIENYPTTVFPDITERIELDSECFKNAIEGVIAATDKFEGILSGVYIDNDKLVTCDQKRIFISALGKNINNIVLPKDLVSEVGRLPFKDKIYLSTFGNSVIIEDGSIFLSCNTLSGKYPKYEAILPKEVRDEFVVDKEVFENALNLVAPIINEDTWECNLEVNNNNMLAFHFFPLAL